jgi:hypothetical protein
MRWAALILVFLVLVNCHADPMVGRISVTNRAEIDRLVDLGFCVYHDELEGVVDLVLSQEDIEILQSLGYDAIVLAPLPQKDQIDLDPEYHTYIELMDELQLLATQYPNLCKLDSIGHTTQFDRTIWCMKLSDNPSQEEDELALIYIGTHHGSEALGLETTLLMINTFLDEYGIDPQITAWMDNYEIFFIPLINPDGHYAVTEGINEFWRKNARDIDGDSIYYEFTGGTWWTDDHEGIDLNRNYNWYWELGGSGYMWDHDYRGEFPFSESELQPLKPLLVQQRFVCGISFHSYGEVVIYPWDWPGADAPDQDVLDTMAEEMANIFINDYGNAYDYYTAGGQNGQCRNWLYGFAGTLAFCVEVNPYPIFLPPGSELAERTQRYMDGAVYLLDRLNGPGITGHVRDALTGDPLGARVEIQGRISNQVKPRFAEPEYGRFTRLLNNGTYTVFAGMAGYYTQRIEGVVVQNNLTDLDIELQPVVSYADGQGNPSSAKGVHFEITNITNPYVSFSLEIAHPTHLELSIYNMMGQKVAEVVDGWRDAGMHEVMFDGSGLASGVYLAKLETANFQRTMKLLLIK